MKDGPAAPAKKFKIIVEYDGTNYAGWARQKNGVAIQTLIEKAVKGTTGEDVEVDGVSRTDAGVHALGQVAMFSSNTQLAPRNLLLAINSRLPDDIRLKSVEPAADDFHPRDGVRAKWYRYTVHSAPCSPAIGRQYVAHTTYRLDIEKMREAAKYLIGSYDFSAFTANIEEAKRRKKELEREIFKLDISVDGPVFHFDIEGDGFLHHMIRNIVGTLVDVGRGRFSPKDVLAIRDSRDRKRAGPTMPPSGLCLMQVFYE